MSKSNPEFQKPPANRKAWDSFWDKYEKAKQDKTKKGKNEAN